MQNIRPMKKLRFILITLLFQSAFGQDLSIHAGLFTTSQKAVYQSKISKELVYMKDNFSAIICI